MKRCSLVLLLSLLSTLLVACNASPTTRVEQSTLPRIPITMHSRDCIWMIDGDVNVVTHGPFCFSGFREKIVIGDVYIGESGHLYVSIRERWSPEKGAGRVIVEFDPVADRKIDEITVPMGPYRLARDGNLLYVGTQDHRIAVIDLKTNEVIEEILLEGVCSPERLALGQDGTLYVAACKTLIVIDRAEDLTSDKSVKFGEFIEDIAVGPDGNLYLLFAGALHIIDSAQYETVTVVPLDGCHVLDIAVAGQGKMYSTCRDRAAVMVYDTSAHIVSSVALPYVCPRVAAVSERYVYLVARDEETVLAIDLESNKLAAEIILPNTAR